MLGTLIIFVITYFVLLAFESDVLNLVEKLIYFVIWVVLSGSVVYSYIIYSNILNLI